MLAGHVSIRSVGFHLICRLNCALLCGPSQIVNGNGNGRGNANGSNNSSLLGAITRILSFNFRRLFAGLAA